MHRAQTQPPADRDVFDNSLSARLYEATNDARYITAANAAAAFVSAHMYYGQGIIDIVRLSIGTPNCPIITTQRSSVSGYALYAFVLLAQFDSRYTDP